MALLNNDTQLSVLVDGLDHPEGIACGPDGGVYAGGEAGQVYRVDIERAEFTEIANTGGFVLGMALDAVGNVYACDLVNKCVQKITPDGDVRVYSTGPSSELMSVPNYPAFDRHGNLYVCDSGGWKEDSGRIFKVPPDGDAVVWDRSLKEFPNGLCIGPNGDSLYVAMSLNPPRIARIDILPDGSAGSIETIVELPRAVPDGVAFDTDGNLYVACYRPDVIYRLSPEGSLDVLADDFEGTIMAAPTNIAFCGPDRDILLGANLGRWHITRYEVNQTGLRLHYPDLG